MLKHFLSTIALSNLLSRYRVSVFSVLAIISCVYILSLASSVDLRFKVWDEKLRQYFWYFGMETKIQQPLSVSILDLYTSETYNASPDNYASRFRSYDLSNSLDIFCKLGAETVAIDFFLDDATWIGKHLNNSQDIDQLARSLSCFKTVWLPLREEEGEWVFPIDHLSRLDNVRFAHVNTYESVLYPVAIASKSSKGELKIPYMAEALAVNESLEHQLKPLLLNHALDSFTRVRFEDMVILKKLEPVMTSEKFRQLFQSYFNNDSLNYPLPKTVIVAFSHDSQDQHDTAYNLAGPIDLPNVRPKANSSSIAYERYGKETAVSFTPGAFLIASTANALAEEETFRPVAFRHLEFFASFGVFVLVVFVIASKWNRQGYKVSLWFAGAALIYVLISYVLLVFNLLLMPLVLPLLVLLVSWVVADYQFGAGLLKQLINISSREFNYQPTHEIDNPHPIIFSMARSQRDSQVDQYKRLIASIDILTFWLQYLALLTMADNLKSDSSMSTLHKKTWETWVRPMLGNYLFILKKLSRARNNAWLSELPFLLNGNHANNLEMLLSNSLSLRNEWKHFASTTHSEGHVKEAMDAVLMMERELEKSLNFLSKFVLIKTKYLKKTDKNANHWDCLVYSGSSTFIDEFVTADDLQPEKLYLFDTRKWGSDSNTLCLEPWIVAEECTYHHREEIFFYSGLIWDRENRATTRTIKYSGLTESCCPFHENEIDNRFFEKMVRK
jgi:hypothetical protein